MRTAREASSNDHGRPSRRWPGRLAPLVLLLAALVGAGPAVDRLALAAEGTAADETRLPGIRGRTLDGEALSTADFPGKRRVILCFNPGIAGAAAYAEALGRLVPEQAGHNFVVFGVALGLDPGPAREFVREHKVAFPVLDDSEADIAVGLGLRSPLMLIGSDPEGRVGLAVAGFEGDDSVSADAIEIRVREYLRLPTPAASAGPAEDKPAAPLFEAEPIEGGDPVRLADLRGRSVVLMFFLSTCPHCQQAMEFFRDELASMPAKQRPAFVGVATDSKPYSVPGTLKEKGFDFFSPLPDEDHAIATAYGSFAGTPDIVLIDKQGRIAQRTMGWSRTHHPDLMRMLLAGLDGRPVPMLLSRDGFSGNDSCEVCHAAEAAAWRFTEHSTAFGTLLVRGRDHDAECVGCHVVGYDEPGGFGEGLRERHLEGVGCETCHGRGGGHLEGGAGTAASSKAPEPATADYRQACEKCHDSKHSLGFDYATFLPRVSHAAIAALGDAEKKKLLEQRGAPRDLLPKASAFIGSAACKTCHEKEHGTWGAGAHAHSIESLRRKGKAKDATCLRCHVTGYGRAGGFPEGADPALHGDLARVGCESCHGPGADHVRAEGKQPAGILRLGDKCDSCVILQICGSCHDEDNDPGFRFEVERRIEAQRHGGPAPAH